MDLANETKELIQESHDIRLQIYEQGKRLAHLQKLDAVAIARFNSINAADKKLTNADKRIRNETELLRIELQFNSDMIKLNLALINAQQ